VNPTPEHEQARAPQSAGSAAGRVAWTFSSCYPLLFMAALHVEWFYLWDVYGMRPDSLALYTPFNHELGPFIHGATELFIATAGPVAAVLVVVLMVAVALRANWLRATMLKTTISIWFITIAFALFDPFGVLAWRLD